MTISIADMALYAFALFLLFLTPGPVWVALGARTLSGGFRAAWPLALGVVVGDIIWPFLAIIGMAWIVNTYAGFMELLRWVACITFVAMGYLVIRGADKMPSQDNRLTRPGMWAGFFAGVVVIMSNPKAILFYMGVLPGFFDLRVLTILDMCVIALLSAIVPLIGNLCLAAMIERAKRLLQSPKALRRTNITSGCLLIGVGLVIPFT